MTVRRKVMKVHETRKIMIPARSKTITMCTRKIAAAILIITTMMTTGCAPKPSEFHMASKQEQRNGFDITELDRQLKAKEAELSRREKRLTLEWRRDNYSPRREPIKPTPPTKVAGIYVSGHFAGSQTRMNQLIQLIKQTELNAVVIDIKNDSGFVTYNSSIPMVNRIGADRRAMIKDLPALINRLKANNIYIIGRIVTFKDPYLAGSRKALTMKRKSDGRPWSDSRGIAWVDPYKHEVRKYNIDIAKEAARLGVNEIQFDYVRFPDNGRKVDAEVRFDNPRGLAKSETIRTFLRDAKIQLKPLGALVSADVFGMTTSSRDDMGIGQTWEKIAAEVDYISPMIYPSHYSSGNYGVRHPDLNPYTIVKNAVKDGLGKNKSTSNDRNNAVIRPWYQAFTASWVRPHKRYGKAEVLAQIRAAREQGVDQYLLWNPHCKYDFIK